MTNTAPAIEAPISSRTNASIQNPRRIQVDAAEQRVGFFNQELRPMNTVVNGRRIAATVPNICWIGDRS
ncbi:MAG: hypothetical protein AAEC03_01695 [Synechococcus sp.]